MKGNVSPHNIVSPQLVPPEPKQATEQGKVKN